MKHFRTKTSLRRALRGHRGLARTGAITKRSDGESRWRRRPNHAGGPDPIGPLSIEITSAEAATCRMTDADMSAARRAAKRGALTKAYAVQAEMDCDGVVSLIAAPTDTNSRKPVFIVSRARPGVVSVTRVDQAEVEEMGELGTITEAVRMVCHHARFAQAETAVKA